MGKNYPSFWKHREKQSAFKASVYFNGCSCFLHPYLCMCKAPSIEVNVFANQREFISCNINPAPGRNHWNLLKLPTFRNITHTVFSTGHGHYLALHKLVKFAQEHTLSHQEIFLLYMKWKRPSFTLLSSEPVTWTANSYVLFTSQGILRWQQVNHDLQGCIPR